jgi:ABC-type multidrug transport system ATPase subunit
MDVVGTADPSAAALLLSAAPPTRREADEAELLAAAAGAPAARKSRAELLDAVLADDGGAAFAARLGAALRAAGGAPTVTVEYRGLGVEVDALVGASSAPSVWNSAKGVLRLAACRGGLETRPVAALVGASGRLEPGRLTLVLGPPGSGKSLLMQALAGRLRPSRKLRISGTITYNGEAATDFEVARTAGFCTQSDFHIPNMTCIETTRFAAECQLSVAAAAPVVAAVERSASMRRLALDAAAAGADGAEEGAAGAGCVEPEAFAELFKSVVAARLKPEITLRLVGLSHAADTIVGSATVRGVSGGERKRVTTAEVLVGNQHLLCMDEISTGLDSATTFSVVRMLKGTAAALGRTTVVSLLQPAPEVVELFDDLILLTDGRVLFHGPVAEVLPFFASIGYPCPPRKDPASFLQEVTTPLGQRAYATAALLDAAGVPPAERGPAALADGAPPTDLLTPIAEIEAAFWAKSEAGRALRAKLDGAPFDPKAGHPAALARSRYARPAAALVATVLKRQVLLAKRDRAFYVARLVQTLIVALIVGSLYHEIQPGGEDGRAVISVTTLSTLYCAMGNMPQLAIVFATKRVFYKHRDARLFPPGALAAANTLQALPIGVVEAVFFSCVVYFFAGLTVEAGRFFMFMALIFSASACMGGVFRLLAYAAPSMIVANSIGAGVLLLLMLTNGARRRVQRRRWTPRARVVPPPPFLLLLCIHDLPPAPPPSRPPQASPSSPPRSPTGLSGSTGSTRSRTRSAASR